MNTENINEELNSILSREEIEMFIKLQRILSILNKTSNLTRLIEGKDYWISQIYDSIWPYFQNKTDDFDNKKYIDIGSGCGFPGIAYAITHPHSEIFLIDSSRKKTNALKKIVTEMELKNTIHVIYDRIENITRKQDYRNKFDIGTARAVANCSTVAEYLIPSLNESGLGILYCGKWSKIDQKQLDNSLRILNGSINKILTKFLPSNKGERNIIFIKPIGECPKIYPRKIGTPSKHPLGY